MTDPVPVLSDDERITLTATIDLLEQRRRQLGAESIPEYARTINFLQAIIDEKKKEYPPLRAARSNHESPNTERDERVAAPERIYIHPTSAEYHLNKWPLEESEYVGYVRFDIAATRMRDRCAESAKQIVFAEMARLGISTERGIAVSSKVFTALQSLTLNGEQDKR